MVANLLDLVKEREGLARRVVKLQELIVNYNIDTVDVNLLSLDATRLQKFEDRIEALHAQTYTLCEDEVEFSREHEPDFDTITACIKTLQIKVLSMLNQLKEKKPASTPSPSFKLERIKLPQVSGNFAEWQSFRDLFIASVHKNKTLSGAEKIIHLKSCLTGEAASIVSSFQATEENYKEAWASVLKRFDKKREIIFAHIHKFVDFKPLKEESSSGLRSLSDCINECVGSLKVQKVPVDEWDLILIYHGLQKLDCESRKQWSLEQDEELPNVPEFIQFVETRARALQDAKPTISSKPGPSSSSTKPASPSPSSKKTSSHAARQSSPLSCAKCCKNHHLYQCREFSSLPVADRRDLVTSKQLCFTCLFAGHQSRDCTMQFKCKCCGSKHHTLLHQDPVQAQPPIIPAVGSENSVTASAFSRAKENETVVLLATLLISAEDLSGQKQVCRVFLDPGSESNFVTESCVQRLRLPRKKTCVSVSGIGGVASEQAKGLVNLRLHSRTSSFSMEVGALVYRKLTASLLPRKMCKTVWSHLEGLKLADPFFYQPSGVDILLGASAAAAILLPGLIHGPPTSPVAQLTQFGWMLSGSVPSAESSVAASPATSSSTALVIVLHATCSADRECLQDSLEKFWKLEELEESDRSLSSEDQQCEDHFAATHQRTPDGSYIVELPFANSDLILGRSRESAVKRFLRVENRLLANPVIHTEYVNAMRQAMELGFLEPVPPSELDLPPSASYYLPHREVVKETSSSTKVRIVYDASAKTTTGNSLNDLLVTGPKLQIDLIPLLIRFRSHLVAMSADIEKFYPQFRVAKRHVDFQRLVWRESRADPICDYRLLRVTFGVTSAPFLAIRSLHQLAEDEKEDYPVAARVIKEEFLVDNLLSGAKDVNSALQLQADLLSVMQRGQLNLTKWTSNSHALLQSLHPSLRECQSALTIDDSEDVRTIGLLWRPGRDTFGISIAVPDISSNPSKRKVLSSLARTFDPLGWASPVTIRPKILIQELWKAKTDWDSELPASVHQEWAQYCRELPLLREFTIDRCITRPPGQEPAARYELHGFCDASQVAYAACVYLRTVDQLGQSSVNLVIAKAKVAPVKSETIPRLELCGAVLLSKLMKVVRECLQLNFNVVLCWTDSMIVIGWLSTSDKLPVFQSNRVRQIQQLLPAVPWFHVPGEENPADIPTRRISAASFIRSRLWLHGPEWLTTHEFPSSTDVSSLVSCPVPDHFLTGIVNNISSFSKMQRVAAFCLRFVESLHQRRPLNRALTSVELERGLSQLVACVQAEAFQDELVRCKRQELIKSRVKFLSPFVDDSGILRVGGRLRHSTQPFVKRHPILLPTNHNFVKQLVWSLHVTHLHAGPQLLLAISREKFWIIRGLDVAKRTVRSCVTCHRFSPHTTSQLMGQLPAARVTPARPFSQCGMDFAGPFVLCVRPGRNPVNRKAYVALFICMATRAIHLELVEDLSTAAFIGALTRLVSRRGLPADLYSDGGKNFVGASNEMKEVQRWLQSHAQAEQVLDFMAGKGVRFHFNPPAAPHHGGLWEAGVKSMKHHLKRVVGDRKLSIEEFYTLLAQVEACLNSRPLAPMSNDPSDFDVLTPGHFLVGSSLHSLPQHDLTQLQPNRISRWQAVQQMLQHFWRRWHLEYAASLQTRPKWLAPTPNIEVGMLVLIRDDDTSLGPLKWRLGRVCEVHQGIDGKVRVCSVSLPSGLVLKRPIVKLSPLPIYSASASDPLAAGAAKLGENVQTPNRALFRDPELDSVP